MRGTYVAGQMTPIVVFALGFGLVMACPGGAPERDQTAMASRAAREWGDRAGLQYDSVTCSRSGDADWPVLCELFARDKFGVPTQTKLLCSGQTCLREGETRGPW